MLYIHMTTFKKRQKSILPPPPTQPLKLQDDIRYVKEYYSRFIMIINS